MPMDMDRSVYLGSKFNSTRALAAKQENQGSECDCDPMCIKTTASGAEVLY